MYGRTDTLDWKSIRSSPGDDLKLTALHASYNASCYMKFIG